jgi:hypothetical protein
LSTNEDDERPKKMEYGLPQMKLIICSSCILEKKSSSSQFSVPDDPFFLGEKLQLFKV